ncbi:MAG: cobyrinate a,c-diamide synthase [Lachnospiraceae bacterium]
MNTHRLMISALGSGSGKTLFTCGLLQVLQNRKLVTASFKCGPDYIDPMFHRKVTGSLSRNLDSFFLGETELCSLLAAHGEDTDISVLEGVMGFYDGLNGTQTRASAYDVAKMTKTPVVLLVNANGMSVSVVPLIQGFLQYTKDHTIKGVILNRISPMIYPRMKEMIESELKIKVFGYLPYIPQCQLESRHLGLLLPDEIENLKDKVHELAGIMEQSVDIEGLLEMAAETEILKVQRSAEVKKRNLRIGVARDEAFCFFYEENFALLERLGVELIWFSPIHDRTLPENLDGILLYGGYPELFLEKLCSNQSMKHSIAESLMQGMPCMAECGGFMYLQESIEDEAGKRYPMCGVLLGNIVNKGRLTRFGYITIHDATAFGERIPEIRAHEFHYYDSDHPGDDWLAVKPVSGKSWNCMHAADTILAGFLHLYYPAYPQLAEAFLNKCGEYHRQKQR